MDNNRSRKIVYSLGDELETFIDSLDDVKNSVYIAYHAKRRYYGAKVLVTVEIGHHIQQYCTWYQKLDQNRIYLCFVHCFKV